MMANLLKVLQDAGFAGERLREAWAIAMRESGGRADAHNDNTATGDDSYGIFQINMLGALGPERDAKFKQYVDGYTGIDSLFDPDVNARAAAYMSQKGNNWQSWVSPQYGAAADFYNKYPGSSGDTDTGARSGTTTSGSPVVAADKLTKKSLAESYAIPWSFVQTHDDIMRVFRNAIANYDLTSAVGKTNFINDIRGTSWYMDNDMYARQYLFDQSAMSDADKATQTKTAIAAVQAEAVRIGAVLDTTQTAEIAKSYLLNGWDQTGRDQLLTQALTGSLPGFDTSFLDYQHGGAATLVQSLKAVAKSNGVTYDDGYYQGAARAILGKIGSADTYAQEIRSNAASRYPVYADRIMAGENAADIASPYVKTMESVLELVPGQVTLDTPEVRAALGQADPKNGQPYALGLYDYEQQLRKDPRFKQTRQYENQFLSVGTALARKWGVL